MLLFTSLYFPDPSGSNRFFLRSLLLSHGSRISVTQGFFLVMFGEDLTGCFSHCCVVGGDRRIHACIFIVYDVERCKLPAYHSLKGFQHIGIFQLFEVKLVCFGLLILFSWSWKVIISKSWSLPMSAPGKLRVLAMFIPDRKRFLTRM